MVGRAGIFFMGHTFPVRPATLECPRPRDALRVIQAVSGGEIDTRANPPNGMARRLKPRKTLPEALAALADQRQFILWNSAAPTPGAVDRFGRAIDSLDSGAWLSATSALSRAALGGPGIAPAFVLDGSGFFVLDIRGVKRSASDYLRLSRFATRFGGAAHYPIDGGRGLRIIARYHGEPEPSDMNAARGTGIHTSGILILDMTGEIQGDAGTYRTVALRSFMDEFLGEQCPRILADLQRAMNAAGDTLADDSNRDASEAIQTSE